MKKASRKSKKKRPKVPTKCNSLSTNRAIRKDRGTLLVVGFLSKDTKNKHTICHRADKEMTNYWYIACDYFVFNSHDPRHSSEKE